MTDSTRPDWLGMDPTAFYTKGRDVPMFFVPTDRCGTGDLFEQAEEGEMEAPGEGPTEGDLLRAELARLGWPSELHGDRGVTYLMVPVDPADADKVPEAPHLQVYAGERADRPAAEHDEPWTAHLHDSNGDYVDELWGGADEPLDAARDAAVTARAIVERLREKQPKLQIGSEAL